MEDPLLRPKTIAQIVNFVKKRP
jgi:hypothetical protein